MFTDCRKYCIFADCRRILFEKLRLSAFLLIAAGSYLKNYDCLCSWDCCGFLFEKLRPVAFIQIVADSYLKNYDSLHFYRSAQICRIKKFADVHFYRFLAKSFKKKWQWSAFTDHCQTLLNNCAEIMKLQTCADLWPKKFPDDVHLILQ